MQQDGEAATLTGGEGQDRFEVSVLNFRGEDEGVFAVITDFDPDEDVLVVRRHPEAAAKGGAELQNVTLIPADDGSYTDVRLDYVWQLNDNTGTTFVRVLGVPNLTADQIVVQS